MPEAPGGSCCKAERFARSPPDRSSALLTVSLMSPFRLHQRRLRAHARRSSDVADFQREIGAETVGDSSTASRRELFLKPVAVAWRHRFRPAGHTPHRRRSHSSEALSRPRTSRVAHRTFDLGTAPPLVSVTVPVMAPVVSASRRRSGKPLQWIGTPQLRRLVVEQRRHRDSF